VWFDELNLWRRRVFSARPAVAAAGVGPVPLSAQRTSAL
jgi:hypothetical protein